MKNHSKVGGKKGKPAYRTPSTFRSNKQQNLNKINKKFLNIRRKSI